MESREAKPRRRFQIRLSTIMYLMLVFCLWLGWHLDHQRLEDARRPRWQEHRLLTSQVSDLVYLLADIRSYPRTHDGELLGHRFGKQTVFRWTADEYLDRLTKISTGQISSLAWEDREFAPLARCLSDAPDDVYAEVLPQMLSCLQSPQDHVRIEMAGVLQDELTDPRQRIEPFRADILSKLDQLLGDPSHPVRRAAAQALAEMGTEARSSVSRLEQLVTKEQNPQAMLALCQIAPNTQRVERVKKWIHDRQPQWEVLANSLSQAMPREEAIAFLRQEFFRTGDYQLQDPIVGAINQLEIEGLKEQRQGDQR